jgi:hypothetical protein
MSKQPMRKQETLVQCEVCLKEVPRGDAQSSEVHEYVLYFCGLECYHQWHEEPDPPTRPDE